MASSNPAAASFEQVKETVAGLATAAAYDAGWELGAAAFIGLKAQEGAVSRIAAGQPVDAALAASVLEAEQIVMLDQFAQAFAECGDADRAFERATETKRRTMADAGFGDATFKAARSAFHDALKGGVSPHAAFVSAYCAGAAAGRLAGASAQ